MTVHKLKLKLSNAYLIRDEGCILIDSGSPNDFTSLVQALAERGVTPKDLSLIAHTHVHSDHVGSAAALRQITDAPLAYHPADEPIMARGDNGTLTGIGLRGKMFSPFFSRTTFEPFSAEVALTDGMTLEPWGVRARLMHTPGHTPGSVSFLLAAGGAVVGDVWMGGFMGGNVVSTRPNHHYFAEDERQLRASMRQLLNTSATTFYVGHGGPLQAASVRRWAERHAAD